MTSYSFAEPCSGRDCVFCGPLPTPEEVAWESWENYYKEMAEYYAQIEREQGEE